MKNNKDSLLSIYSVILAMISVQSGTAIAKYLFPVLGASGVVSVRLGLASLMLLVVFKVKVFARKKSDYLACLYYGICIAGMNLSFYFAIKLIPMGLGTAIEFIGPLVLAISTSRKHVDFIWAILAGLGIAIMAPWSNSGAIDFIGVSLAGLAGIFWAGYILCGKSVSRQMKPTDAVALGMLVAFLIALPFGIGDGVLERLDPKWLLMGGGVALLSSAIPFSLDMKAFKNISSRTYSILMSLSPAFAAFSGLIFLGERLDLIQSCAVLFVVVASIGSSVTSRK